MKKLLLIFVLMHASPISAQSNTTASSGSIGKCSVWGYPYTLYNNSGSSQTVSDGITVTVDQNRNIGAVTLSGSGAMVMSGSNGITLSGNGGDISCRWDISRSESHTVVNNNGDSSGGYGADFGVFFTAPYSGTYRWAKGNGTWGAGMSGAYGNGGLGIKVSSLTNDEKIFYQNISGTCGQVGTYVAPLWKDVSGPLSLSAGQSLSYRAGTIYDSGPCSDTTLNLSIGNATVFYDN